MLPLITRGVGVPFTPPGYAQATPMIGSSYPVAVAPIAISPASVTSEVAPVAVTTPAGTPTSTTATAANPLASIVGTDPTTGATTIFGFDWYWVAGAALALFLLMGRRR